MLAHLSQCFAAAAEQFISEPFFSDAACQYLCLEEVGVDDIEEDCLEGRRLEEGTVD